jgi:hypothetical protein
MSKTTSFTKSEGVDIIWLTMIKGKQVCDSYANWLMSSNKWIYKLLLQNWIVSTIRGGSEGLH